MGKQQTHTSSKRSRQIANALLRHGLGYLIGIVGLEHFVPFHKGLLKHPRRTEPYTRPEHIRMALEELGPTFMKLGQILSTRADLLPPDYQTEFAKLQDAAPTLPREVIEKILVAELGQPVEDLFATFDFTPLAAASIGQAHAATLLDGTQVVVKVRRPGAVEQIEEDLALLHNLATTASHRWEFVHQYDLVGLVRDFAKTLRAELDYVGEGKNAERFAKNFAHDTTIHIPRIFWKTTTTQVLTLERIYGIKINDLTAIDAVGLNRSVLAEHAAHSILKMIFEDGFFHADPHPGNFFIEANGRIGLIDFGMVGIVDENTREALIHMLVAITRQDTERLVDAFLDLGVTQQAVDRPALQRDLDLLLSRYYSVPLGEMAVGPLLNETLSIVRHHHLQLPSNLVQLIKATIMNEGLGTQLDPSFRLTTTLVPFARRLILRQYSPAFLAKQLGQTGMDAAWLGVELPQQLRRLLSELEHGTLKVSVQSTGVEPTLRRFEMIANRIVLGVIAAAFINGLAVLMSVYHPVSWGGWIGTFFAVGFVLAAVLGLYLAWSILRSKHT